MRMETGVVGQMGALLKETGDQTHTRVAEGTEAWGPRKEEGRGVDLDQLAGAR